MGGGQLLSMQKQHNGDARWIAVAITMDNGSKIMMDGSSGNGQQLHNGRQDSKVDVMGNGTAVAQWMAQLAVNDCRQCRSGAMGGNARWMAGAITMDGRGVITMDGSGGDGQWQCNRRQDS